MDWSSLIDYIHTGWIFVADFLQKTWWFWSLPPVWGVLAIIVVYMIIRPRRKW